MYSPNSSIIQYRFKFQYILKSMNPCQIVIGKPWVKLCSHCDIYTGKCPVCYWQATTWFNQIENEWWMLFHSYAHISCVWGKKILYEFKSCWILWQDLPWYTDIQGQKTKLLCCPQRTTVKTWTLGSRFFVFLMP